MAHTSDRAVRNCESCGKPFIPQQPHYTLCPECARGQRGVRREPGEGLSTRLPDDYLSQGYFDQGDNIFPDLVVTMPERIAKLLGVGGVTSTQLRRFYAKAKAIEQRLNAGAPFESVIPSILEFKQHAAYAVGRAEGKNEQAGLELFKQFIDRNVNLAVHSKEAFRKGFLLHFQGVVAYFKYHHPKK